MGMDSFSKEHVAKQISKNGVPVPGNFPGNYPGNFPGFPETFPVPGNFPGSPEIFPASRKLSRKRQLRFHVCKTSVPPLGLQRPVPVLLSHISFSNKLVKAYV